MKKLYAFVLFLGILGIHVSTFSQVPAQESIIISCKVDGSQRDYFKKSVLTANKSATKLSHESNLQLDYFTVYYNLDEIPVTAIFEYCFNSNGKQRFLTIGISLQTDKPVIENYYFDRTIEKEWGKLLQISGAGKVIVCNSGTFIKKNEEEYIKFPDKTVLDRKTLVMESDEGANNLSYILKRKTESAIVPVNAKVTSTGEVFIDGVPNYLWYLNCGLTAETMIIAYWNDKGYGNFIPGGDSKTGHYWAFTEEECFFGELTGTNFNPLTYYAQAKEYGNNYPFGNNSFLQSTYGVEGLWNKYIRMVDSTNNPLEVIWMGPPYGAHATVGIGYQNELDQRFLILNDTWRDTPYYVNYDLYSESVNSFVHYYPLITKKVARNYLNSEKVESAASFSLEPISFNISPALDPGSNAYHSFELADLNGDKAEDLIICNFRNNTGVPGLKIYYKNGDTFLENTAFKPKTEFFECPNITRTFDFDKDGDLDIANAGYWTPVYIYKNEVDSVRQAPIIIDNNGRGFIDLIYGDYNLDGYIDMVSTSVDGQIRIYHNNSGLSFNNALTIDLKSQSYKIKFADLNKDNYPDLIASSRNGTVAVFYNKNGQFLTTPDFLPSGHGGMSFDVADLNNDSWPDIVATNDGKLIIYFNASGILSDTPVHINDNLDCYPKDIVATYLNNDTYPELIIASFNRLNFILANNQGQIDPSPVWKSVIIDPTVNIRVFENSTGVKTLLSGKSRGGKLEFFKVIPNSVNTLAIAPGSQSADYHAGAKSFNLTSNTIWTVSADAEWLTINQTYGSGNATLNVSFTDNTTGAARVATITVTGSGVGFRTVTLNQGAQDLTLPILSTVRITHITKTTAVTGGEISNQGLSAIIKKGVCWSTGENPTVDLTTKTNDGSGSASYVSNITGLSEGTVYFVRAYATNSYGTGYGNQISFRYDNDLLAHYPLITDAEDETGNNVAMTLTNAPFQDGGIYCNGIYNGCTAITPPINGFNFNSFTISADFKVTESLSQPVFVCGQGCRWLGFYLKSDGTVELLYNNLYRLASSKTYDLNKWHNAMIKYDGITARLYLDNELACSINTQLDHAVCGDYDTSIGVVNYSNGDVFKGIIGEVKVSKDGLPTAIKKSEDGGINIFPNPAKNSLFIVGLTSNTQVSIFDMTGRPVVIKRLNENYIDISKLSNGLYIIQILFDNKTITKRFIKQ